MSVTVSISEDDLLCKICNEYILDPKLLPCAHRICGTCLVLLMANDSDLLCPYCRKGFHPDVKTDFLLRSIIEQIEIKMQCETKIVGKDANAHINDCKICLSYDHDKLKHITKLFVHNYKKNFIEHGQMFFIG